MSTDILTSRQRQERIALMDKEFDHWLKKKREAKDSAEIFEAKEEMNIALKRLKFTDSMRQERTFEEMFERRKQSKLDVKKVKAITAQ